MAGLDGKVIAIAGAGGGLGPSVARTLGRYGASLALLDTTDERAEAVVGQAGLDAEKTLASGVDLLSQSAAEGWRDEIVERFGRVDGLMHLVGGWRGGDPLATFDMADYDWLHELLVKTVQNATRAFHDVLVENGGRFALVSSTQAQDPDGTNAAYGATKAAAEAWTLALADSFAEAGGGATANIVVVNAIVTPAMREKNPDKEYPSFTPAEQIADALAFLCGDGGSRMNGQRVELHP